MQLKMEVIYPTVCPKITCVTQDTNKDGEVKYNLFNNGKASV